MSQAMDRLIAEVNEIRDVTAAAAALIQGLAEQVRAASQDAVRTEALANELDTIGQQLAAAVAANTPAGPETPTEPAGGGEGEPAGDPGAGSGGGEPAPTEPVEGEGAGEAGAGTGDSGGGGDDPQPVS